MLLGMATEETGVEIEDIMAGEAGEEVIAQVIGADEVAIVEG